MAYESPPLPYEYSALEPFIDIETMKLHHDKHHQTYITNVNNALANHPTLAANGGSMLQSRLCPQQPWSLSFVEERAMAGLSSALIGRSFSWPPRTAWGSRTVPAFARGRRACKRRP